MQANKIRVPRQRGECGVSGPRANQQEAQRLDIAKFEAKKGLD